MKKLAITKQAEVDLAALDRATKIRIAAGIQRLLNGTSGVGNVKKLHGIDPPEYRLRVGNFRILFSYPDSATVRINRVQDRKESYR